MPELDELSDLSEPPVSPEPPASSATSGGAATEPARPRRSTGRAGRAVAYGLVGLILVAAASWLGVAIFQWLNPGKDAGTGDDAIAAARTQAINIMTLDYRTAKTDLQRVIDGSTGTMKSQYSQGEGGQIAATSAAKSTSTGTVLSAGLSYPNGKSSLSKNAAEVLVIGDATVRFPKTSTAAASAIVVHYRFRFEMQKQHGVWRSSQLNFAGLPTESQATS